MALQSAEDQDLLIDCWLTSTCPQANLKEHLANLGASCGQHVETGRSVFYVGITELRSQKNSSRYWNNIEPIRWPKIPPNVEQSKSARPKPRM